MIYIIRHPNAAFNGVAGGIDFSNGIGSTSSFDDAKRVSGLIKGTFASAEAIAAAIVGDIRPPLTETPAPAPAAGTPKAKAKPGRKPK